MSVVRRASVMVVVTAIVTASCSPGLGTTTEFDRRHVASMASDAAFAVTHEGFEPSIVATTVRRTGGTNDQSNSATRTWKPVNVAAAADATVLEADVVAALVAEGWIEQERAASVRVFQRFRSKALVSVTDGGVVLTIGDA